MGTVIVSFAGSLNNDVLAISQVGARRIPMKVDGHVQLKLYFNLVDNSWSLAREAGFLQNLPDTCKGDRCSDNPTLKFVNQYQPLSACEFPTHDLKDLLLKADEEAVAFAANWLFDKPFQVTEGSGRSHLMEWV